MEACIGDATVWSFVSGFLDAKARAHVECHVNQCRSCSDVVAVLASFAQTATAVSLLPGERAPRLKPSADPPSYGAYKLLRVLGRGGMGVVYEAEHRPSGEHVALKVVRLLASGAVGAMRREIDALQSLSHPGVIRIRDAGSAEGIPYFAMELVQGPSLADALQSGCSTHTLYTILRKICSTLAILHHEGIVHRDLKPKNILLRSPDTPVLVDFGTVGRFAGSAGREALEVAGATMGTLMYMAPEQIAGELVDPRADLYSLGCILYEILAGRAPFVAATPAALARAHREDAPVPPSAFRPVPARLEQLVLRLLAKHPRDRAGYAEDVALELAALGAEDWEDTSPRRARPYLYRPEFVGRAAWLGRFESALQRCAQGHGHCTIVAGESGVGKTRLLTELASLARSSGVSVIVAQCSALTGPEPHTAFRKDSALHAFRPTLRELADRCHTDPALADRLLGPRGRVLAAYEPSLRELPCVREAPAPPAVSSDVARLRLFAYLRESLRKLSQEGPLLLVLDDMQWIDDLSLEFLSSLPHDYLADTPLLIVGAYRADEAPRALRAALSRLSHAEHCALDPLEPDAVRGMATNMLAIQELPSTFLQLLQRQAAGNPFFVAECLRVAVAERWLVRSDSSAWEFVAVPQGELPLPATVQQAIGRRLDSLPSDARAVLELASVLGRSFSASVLTALFERHEPSVATLLARHMLEEHEPGSYRFIHDKIRETVYAALSIAERRALHKRCASALESAGIGLDAELAYHWAEAGQPERAATFWERAGDRALAATAYGDAARYFESVLQSTSHSEALRADTYRVARWQQRLAEAYYGLGEIERSEALLVSCLERYGVRWPATQREQRTFLLRMLGRQLLHLAGRDARSELSLGDVRHAAMAADRLAFILLWKHDSAAMLAATLLAANLTDVLALEAPSTRPYSMLGFVTGLAGLGALSRRYFERSRQELVSVPATDRTYSIFLEVYLRAGEGRWAAAEALQGPGMKLIEAHDDPLSSNSAHAVLGFMLRARGRCADAIATAEFLRRSARQCGNTEHETWSEVLAASCLLRLGRYQPAAGHLERALELLARAPEWVCELRAYAQLAHVRSSTGDAAQAASFADRAMGVLSLRKGPPVLASALDGFASLTHVYLELCVTGYDYQRSLSRAEAALAHLKRLAFVFPVGRSYYYLCRGRAAALHGRRRTALRWLERARRTALRLEQPYEEALVHWHRARLEPSASEARAHRERFEALFARLGGALPEPPRAPG
ncbi:MAG TPA: protein kinase [Polyangiales bacterium]|nr:protein kinase [Polyangiales bacterium]